MRVKAPGDGPPPIPAVDETAGTEAPDGIDGVERASGVARSARIAPTSQSGSIDVVAEVSRRLKAGEITASDAVELLIDDIVDRQAGAALADRRALAEELKSLLRKQTETDPYLASRVRRLGNRQ